MIKRIFNSENLKIKRSFILWVHIASIIVFPALLGGYYGSRYPAVHVAQIIVNYYEFLAILTPLAINIVTCIIFDREQKAGNFKNLLSLSENKAAVIQTQMFYYWALYTIVVLGGTLIYFLILKCFFGLTMPSFYLLLITSMVFSLVALFQYELAYLVTSIWGAGSSLVIGFFGSLLAVLSITVLLDKVWFLIPWSWQIRLIGFWQPGVLENSQIAFWYASKYIPCVILTILILTISSAYYKNWAGKKD